MQTVYATHLTLPSSPDGGALDAAAEALVRWVRSRFRVDLQPLSGGSESRGDTQVRWEQRLGDHCGVISTVIDQVDRGDRSWRWRSYVDLGVEDSAAWLRVRVNLSSAFEGRLTRPRVQAGRPGIVRALNEALSLQADGWGLGEWRTIGSASVPEYLDFLTSPHRQLPVVALSVSKDDDEPFLDPAYTADRLLGLAHVVVVEPDASFAVSDSLGPLSCYWGAVRVYWPGLQKDDDPYHHRLYVGGSLQHFGRDGLVGEIFETLGRLAGLGLGRPALIRRLELEQRAQELLAHESAQAELRQRIDAAVSEGANTGDYADDFGEFAEEFDRMQEQVRELTEANFDAEVESESLRQERDEARSQLVELARSLQGQPNDDDAGAMAESGPPVSVLDAVERAASAAEHSTFLPEAFDSAAESQYQDPSRVLDDLRLVDEVARDWANGELSTGPHDAFKQRCSGYRDGIGQKASTQYAADYERNYDGERVMLGPHIRRGIGAVSAILRIYMHFDTTNQTVVVGHVGRKLRDSGNRN